MPLGELMVLDQLLAGVSEDLRVWLKERRPESLWVAMALADNYALARGDGRAMDRKIPAADLPVPPQERSPQEGGKTALGHKPQGTHMSKHSKINVNGDRQCYQCGQWGHLMFNCPNRKGPVHNGSSKPVLLARVASEGMTLIESGCTSLHQDGGDGRTRHQLIDPG